MVFMKGQSNDKNAGCQSDDVNYGRIHPMIKLRSGEPMMKEKRSLPDDGTIVRTPKEENMVGQPSPDTTWIQHGHTMDMVGT